MGRKMMKIVTLDGCTIEKLKIMKNSSKSEFVQNMLTAVIMRYEGIGTIEIAEFLSKSKQTVIDYIKKWNSKGLKALEGWHGEPAFTAEMIDNIINIVLNSHPNDFGFIKKVWTYPLLVEYIYENYGKRFSSEYIRTLLKRNKINCKMIRKMK